MNSDLLKHLASIRILAGHHVNVEKLLKNHFFLVNKKIFVTANPFLEGHKIAVITNSQIRFTTTTNSFVRFLVEFEDNKKSF